MSFAFKSANEAAEAFSQLYGQRCARAGFLKIILLRRIGSSARAGLETARHLIGQLDQPLVPEEEVGDGGEPDTRAPPDPLELSICAKSNGTCQRWSTA